MRDLSQNKTCHHLLCQECIQTITNKNIYPHKPYTMRHLVSCPVGTCNAMLTGFPRENDILSKGILTQYIICGICKARLQSKDDQVVHNGVDECKQSYCLPCLFKYAHSHILQNYQLPFCIGPKIIEVMNGIHCPQGHCSAKLIGNLTADRFSSYISKYIPFIDSPPSMCQYCNKNESVFTRMGYCNHMICRQCMANSCNTHKSIKCPIENCLGALTKKGKESLALYIPNLKICNCKQSGNIFNHLCGC